MGCVYQHQGNQHSLILSQRFTFADHVEFKTALDHFLQGKHGHKPNQLVINMEKVEFIDSAGLGMLLIAQDEASKIGVTIVLTGANGQVKRMLTVSQFDKLFAIH